jgi:hypothetical protein
MRTLSRRARFVWAAMASGLPRLWSAVGLASLAVGGSGLAALAFLLDRPVAAAVIIATILVLTFGEGAYRLHRATALTLEERTAELRAFADEAPRLTFSRPVIPPESQPIHVFLPEIGGQPRAVGCGRVIRVPVINAHGAGTATRLHARLTFLPDHRDGQFSPRDPAQGEWMGESGPEVEIDLPGNGRPALLDVLVVLDGDYPHAHEWTTTSRYAALRGYAIRANPIEVDIEVLGGGFGAESPRLHDRLRIRLDQGMIAADWASAGDNSPTNWVAWTRRALL